MNNKCFAIVSLVTLLTASGTQQSSISANTQTQTISLRSIGVAFDIPKGYAVLQREVFEGPYATTISFAKELRPGHLRIIHVWLVLWPTAHNGFRPVSGGKPSQYVDAEFQRVKKENQDAPPESGPEYTTLFGNKAIRYTVADFLCCVSLVGFLRPNQLSGLAARAPREYLVRIVAGVDTFDPNDEHEPMLLFDTVANSLRVIK